MRASPTSIEVALARIVIPRSRSRSLESIARSATRWFFPGTSRMLQQAVNQRGLAMVDVAMIATFRIHV